MYTVHCTVHCNIYIERKTYPIWHTVLSRAVAQEHRYVIVDKEVLHFIFKTRIKINK